MACGALPSSTAWCQRYIRLNRFCCSFVFGMHLSFQGTTDIRIPFLEFVPYVVVDEPMGFGDSVHRIFGFLLAAHPA